MIYGVNSYGDLWGSGDHKYIVLVDEEAKTAPKIQYTNGKIEQLNSYNFQEAVNCFNKGHWKTISYNEWLEFQN